MSGYYDSHGRYVHDVIVGCLDGGMRGYQARCLTCGWTGPEHLRGDEAMGTPESRAHKQRARAEMAEHLEQTAVDVPPEVEEARRVIAEFEHRAGLQGGGS